MNPVRVLVAGHDSGGLNLLVPLLQAWSNDSRIVPEFLAAPTVRREIKHRLPDVRFASGADELTEQLFHRQGDLDQYLGELLVRGKYQAVVCGTSAHAPLERRVFLAAKVLSVPSVAFCDMWWAYTERFYDGQKWTLPDRLWVIDEPMRAAAANIQWPAPLAIEVVGSPLFAGFSRRQEASDRKRGSAIRFISEPASTKFPEAGINEFELADMLLKAASSAQLDIPLIVRPHPTDSMEAWRRWTFARRETGVSLDPLPLEEAIWDTRLAVGISSILLAELRMHEVPAASLQLAGCDQSYYCLPFQDLGIAKISDSKTLRQWLTMPGKRRPPDTASIHLSSIETATRLLLCLVAPKSVVV